MIVPLFAAASLFVLLAFLIASSASAQAFKKGVRVSATSVDTSGVGMEVNISVEMFTTGGGAFTSALGNSAAPAIDWGDGSTVGYTSVPYYPGGPVGTDPITSNSIYRFRGTFSHTYPDLDPRNITVASGCCSNQGSATFTGYRQVTTGSTKSTWMSPSPTPSGGSTTFTFTTFLPYGPFTNSDNVPPQAVNDLQLALDLGTHVGTAISPFSQTNTTFSSTDTDHSSTHGSQYRHYQTTTYYGTGFGKSPGFTHTILLDVIFTDGFESGDATAWN